MRQRNIFRFVSIRPPAPAPEADGRAIELDSDAIADLLDMRRAIIASQKTPAEARRAVAVAVASSDAFFLNDPQYPIWRSLLARFQELPARPSENEVKAIIEAGADELGVPVEPQDFAYHESVAPFRTRVAKSYVAVAIDLAARTELLIPLTEWARFFALAEMLRNRTPSALWPTIWLKPASSCHLNSTRMRRRSGATLSRTLRRRPPAIGTPRYALKSSDGARRGTRC